MTGRKTILGLCMLCALVFSSIAAQAASATGQTAFTCVSTASSKQFSSAHCVPGETGTSFGHVAFTEETHAKFSNANTNATTNGPSNWILRLTAVGVNLELESTGVVEGLGTVKNEELGGGMQASGSTDANGITFNGVIVKAPAGKGCVVRQFSGGPLGVIKTKQLKGHTTVVTDKEDGGGTAVERHSVIIEPQTGTLLATFWIDCTDPSVPPTILGNWEVTGTLTCPTRGATINCNHNTLTEANTLKAMGFKAGLQGKATVTAGQGIAAEGKTTNPVSVTTTTP